MKIKFILIGLVGLIVANSCKIFQSSTMEKLMSVDRWYLVADKDCTYVATLGSIFKKNRVDFYMKDTVFVGGEHSRYYLSDVIDTVFDESKVGRVENGKYIVQLGKGGKTWVHEIIVLNDSSFVMNLVYRPKDEVRIGVPRKLMYVTKNHKLKWKIIEAPKKN